MSTSRLRSSNSIVSKIATYHHQLVHRKHPKAFKCPRCHLTVKPPVQTRAPQHCPRCLGRDRDHVELTPPSGEAR